MADWLPCNASADESESREGGDQLDAMHAWATSEQQHGREGLCQGLPASLVQPGKAPHGVQKSAPRDEAQHSFPGAAANASSVQDMQHAKWQQVSFQGLSRSHGAQSAAEQWDSEERQQPGQQQGSSQSPSNVHDAQSAAEQWHYEDRQHPRQQQGSSQGPSNAHGAQSAAEQGVFEYRQHPKQQQGSSQGPRHGHDHPVVEQGPKGLCQPIHQAERVRKQAPALQRRPLNPFTDLTNCQNPPKVSAAMQVSAKPTKPYSGSSASSGQSRAKGALPTGQGTSSRILARCNAENEYLEDSDGVSSAAKRHCSDRSSARASWDALSTGMGNPHQQCVVAGDNLEQGMPSAAILRACRAAGNPAAAVPRINLLSMKPTGFSSSTQETDRAAEYDRPAIDTPGDWSARMNKAHGPVAPIVGNNKMGENPPSTAVPRIDLQRVKATTLGMGSHRASATGSSQGATPRAAAPGLMTAEARSHRGLARASTNAVTPGRANPRGRQACGDQPGSGHGPLARATPRERQACSAEAGSLHTTRSRWVSSTKTDSKAVTPELTPQGRDACAQRPTPTPRCMSGTKADPGAAEDTPRGHGAALGGSARRKSAAAQSLADSLKRRASLNSLRSSTAQHASKKRGQSHSSHTESSGSGANMRHQPDSSHARDSVSISTRHSSALDRGTSGASCTGGSGSTRLRPTAAASDGAFQPAAPSVASSPRHQKPPACMDDTGSLSMRHMAASNRALKQSCSGASTRLDRGQTSQGTDSGNVSLEAYAAAYRASKRTLMQAATPRESRCPSHTNDPSSVSLNALPGQPAHASHAVSFGSLSMGEMADSVRPARAAVTRYVHALPETPSTHAARRLPVLQSPMHSFSPQQSSPGGTCNTDESTSVIQENVSTNVVAGNASSHALLRESQSLQDEASSVVRQSGAGLPSMAGWPLHAFSRMPQTSHMQCSGANEATPLMARRLSELQDPIQSFSPEQSSPDIVYSDEVSSIMPSDEASSSDMRSHPSAESRWQGMRLSNSPLYEPSLRGSEGPSPQCFQQNLRRCEGSMKGPESLRESGSTTTEIVWSAAFNACSNPTFCPTFGE